MCGIFGIVGTGAHKLQQTVTNALSAQDHRGPDASGTWWDEHCALGHNRLAIIDLSEGGRQPLCNEDGTVWITFNGEIYNFQELRTELEGLGHQFRTRTDTEVIVHAYEEWDTDCVRRLRGMFAFAIWDQPRQRLYAARDRVGKKPLFFTHRPDRLMFASELQGLLADPSAPRELDLKAIDSYLSWGYIPPPRTAFRGINKLPAAHWMTAQWTPHGVVLDGGRYWTLEYLPKTGVAEEDAATALRETLTEAVRLRMISDVPIGAFLSGGIDSSIVVGLMAQLSDRPVKTFSIGFDEAGFNELEHAARVAKQWGTDHQEFVVRPDAVDVLPRMARHYGEPFADDTALPTYYLAQMTREHVTVALNGDGGDESFLGYERYRGNRLAERIRSVPGSGAAIGLLRKALPDSPHRKHPLRKFHRFTEVAQRPMAERYARWIGYFDADEKSALYTPDLRDTLGTADDAWLADLFDQIVARDPAEQAMAVDVLSYLPYDLLVKVDIATMMHSLEARSPFLDHEVMELAARFPADYKLRGGDAKYLLKKAFADLMPPENARRGKMGFGVPVGDWFRGPLRTLLLDLIDAQGSFTRAHLRPESVKDLLDQHCAEKVDLSMKLWNLLMLELWHAQFQHPAPATSSVTPIQMTHQPPVAKSR